MQRIVIFGNSGSGKSTLAKSRAETLSCLHLDLDTIAWAEGRQTPTRREPAESQVQIDRFLAEHQQWVIEGCYSDLLRLVMPFATEIVFLNPGVQTCIDNCKNRPWEPHKYESMEAQNRNLEHLFEWIRQYQSRTDEFSYTAHRQLFDSYQGKKQEYTSNERGE